MFIWLIWIICLIYYVLLYKGISQDIKECEKLNGFIFENRTCLSPIPPNCEVSGNQLICYKILEGGLYFKNESFFILNMSGDFQ